MRATSALLWTMLAGSLLLSGVARAKSADDVLQDIKEDARRDAENSVRSAVSKRFPYNGSLYGLPGQTRSDSIREQAIRSAIGGLFGSCKKPGSNIDLSRLPGGLNMDVSGILSNTTVQVPPLPSTASNNHSILNGISAIAGGSAIRVGSALDQAQSLIPPPTEVANGQVKVNGSWMPVKDYQARVAETQAALNQAVQQQARTAGEAVKRQIKESGAAQKPAATAKPAVSRIWAQPAK